MKPFGIARSAHEERRCREIKHHADANLALDRAESLAYFATGFVRNTLVVQLRIVGRVTDGLLQPVDLVLVSDKLAVEHSGDPSDGVRLTGGSGNEGIGE